MPWVIRAGENLEAPILKLLRKHSLVYTLSLKHQQKTAQQDTPHPAPQPKEQDGCVGGVWEDWEEHWDPSEEKEVRVPVLCLLLSPG